VLRTPNFNVQLEVTTRCNDDCLYCPRAAIIKSEVRQIADADLSLFSLIVQQLKAFKPRAKPKLVISISGLGEPLLYPQLLEVVSILRTLGPEVHIRLNTNGILLYGEHARKLINSEIDSLRCSLNLATEQLFHKYRPQGDFNRVKDNIIQFLQLKGARKPRVQVRINGFDVNKPFMKASQRFWSQWLNPNDVFEVGGFSNWAGKITRESYVARPLPPRTPCKYLWNNLTVNVEGDVFPCCLGIADNRESSLCIGNIYEGPTLLELYTGEGLKQLRLHHQQKHYPFPCSLCDSYGSTI